MHISYHFVTKAFMKSYAETLEHAESPIRVLREIRRVTKKDGTAFITVPNITELRRIISISRNPLRVRRIEVDHKQG